MKTSELVQPRHLDRKAMIYIRQSSPNQVLTNKESQRMQYALRERAVGLGWHEQDTHFVDTDLGRSGTTIEQREGFQQLVADIALGTVGILLAFDATRLARNCSHWYQLLDLCGLHDCLIADRDGVYNPSSINGRLLLGLKGQISELELHTIRARLTAGILSKAERGELGLTLPTGLIRTDGVVTKHPSVEVQDRINLIFTTFFEQKSVAQTVRWFIKNDLRLPRRDRHGDIHWKRVTAASISSFLNNPAYAGAATYGRSRWKKSHNTGKMQQKKLPPQQWRYCVKDMYPQYITWETFERIQAMLRDNYTEYARNKTRGVPREGKALMHGIMYCGECGHKMCVQYKGGTQYLCNHLKQQTGAPVCQRIAGDTIDDTIVSWFFEALSVAEIDVAAAALQSTDTEHLQVVAAHQQQVERLRYEAQRAERQFMKSDPDNRLVTGELERRWEFTLRELKSAEEEYERLKQDSPSYIIPEDLLDALRDIGPRLPEIWNAKLLSDAQKKALLRSLIDKVVIHRVAPDQVQTRVVWRGGATTSDIVRVTVGKFALLSGAKEMEATIKRMAIEGHSDIAIAERLTQKGHRSPRADKVLESTVRNTRLRLGIMRKAHQSHPCHVEGFLTTIMVDPPYASRPSTGVSLCVNFRVGSQGPGNYARVSNRSSTETASTCCCWRETGEPGAILAGDQKSAK
ncbi:MAG: recombinase family protein [Pirellulaceae bacterium]